MRGLSLRSWGFRGGSRGKEFVDVGWADQWENERAEKEGLPHVGRMLGDGSPILDRRALGRGNGNWMILKSVTLGLKQVIGCAERNTWIYQYIIILNSPNPTRRQCPNGM